MKNLLLAAAFFFSLCCSAFDNCIPPKPSPPRLVNNFSKEFPDFLSREELQRLENKLQQFGKETSNQIVIVIVDDLCGYDANEFSTRLGQQWGVGQEKFDNGVVVLIKPSGGAGQREAYIAVGYGLEGVIPDIAAKRIVDRELIGYFKTGAYYTALDEATNILMGLAKKEFVYADYDRNYKIYFHRPVYVPLVLFFIIILLIIIFRKRAQRYTTIGGGRTYYGRSWGSWGGSGGGSGGFGGGGFGGGGAGGKW